MGPVLAFKVFSFEGNQRHKQITLMHKVGTSDISVHRALRELLGQRTDSDSTKKVKAGQPTCMCAKWLQSCGTLCNPMDCSLPGSSVPGVLQAKILEWVAIPFSRESSQPRD